ncbi:MAG: hypothetical protein P1V81_00145 [Planctomycetota bacterium]|nr:hypothetical protein [Planctomycetota bacterium]
MKRSLGLGSLALVGLLLPACGPSAGTSSVGGEIGVILEKGDGTRYVVEENASGKSTSMFIKSISFGRLVDEVYDDAGTLLHRDLVIGQDIESDGLDYLLETNPISRTTRLTILHDFDTSSYKTAFDRLFLEMDDLLTKSLAAWELPPYSMVPRNSTIVLTLSDLIDPATVNAENIKVLTGYGPDLPFQARLAVDPNFGAELAGEFYSTRIQIDPVVTASEAFGSGLPVNGLGLPGAVNTSMPNLALRIPTATDFGAGQFTLLSNLTAHPLGALDNLPIDGTVSTKDVVRALRTGGLTEKIGDPHNGFMPDEDSPEVVGLQSVTINSVAVDFGKPAGNYIVDLTYLNINCAASPKVGDIITQPGVFLEVTESGSSPIGGVVAGVRVATLTEESGAPFESGAQYSTRWDPAGVIGADCFVEFDPPAGIGTNQEVALDASVILRFSEPMDPDLLTPFDSFVVSRVDEDVDDLAIRQLLVGNVTASPDLQEFRFDNSVPFYHPVQGAADDFFVQLNVEEGVVDLAGNGLAKFFPRVQFFTVASAPANRVDHRAFRFARAFDDPQKGSIVDDYDIGIAAGEADIRGQYVYDAVRGTISPRPVDRFSQVIDRNLTVPAWHTANAVLANGGLLGTFAEPLNPLGCKMMSLWRYFDMGLDVQDEAYVNIDIEHINWAPIGSNVISEFYPDFQVSLALTSRFPDESYLSPPNMLVFPQSGLLATSYEENLLLDPNNQLTLVHKKESGYFIDPVDIFKASTQANMFPYPVNTGVPASQFKYWTFRDTATLTRGGSNVQIGLEPPVLYDFGIDPDPNSVLVAIPTDWTTDPPTPAVISFGSSQLVLDNNWDENGDDMLEYSGKYCPDGTFIPSFGLPLLTEFRCYSSDDAIGINRLDTSIAMAPVWAVGVTPQTALTALPKQPTMRIFSSGGVDTTGKDVYKDPDLEVVPTGYFNKEVLLAPLGAPLPGADNIFYMGQLDFVIRVSRVHTHWHEANVVTNAIFAEPVIEPRNDQQPQGCSVQLHFRGADTMNNIATTDADILNMYGDLPGTAHVSGLKPASPLYWGDPAVDNQNIGFDTTLGSTWAADINQIDGNRYYQVRITFINNAATGTFPELSSLGIAYQDL